MFIEGFECADECATVLKDDSHPVVDELNHLVVLADRLQRQINVSDSGFSESKAQTIVSVLTILAESHVGSAHTNAN